MNEHDLMEALQDHAADVAVGPAPLDSMARSATTTRRRRRVAAGIAAACVVVAGVGVVAVLPGDDTASDPAPAARDDVADVPPDGFRYVGVNRAAVAVPEEWPINSVNCFTPTETTAIVDVAVDDLCLPPYPADTDSVEVREAIDGEDFSTWTPVEVDGVDALRSPAANGVQASGPRTYEVRVYVPGERVVFIAQSSIGPDHVDDLLDRIVFLDDQVAVPGISDLGVYRGSGRADELYLTRLADAGLEAEIVPQTDKIGYEPGTVIDVEPEAGTVVEPGSTVRVTVAD